jgi:hypothetical protein
MCYHCWKNSLTFFLFFFFLLRISQVKRLPYNWSKWWAESATLVGMPIYYTKDFIFTNYWFIYLGFGILRSTQEYWFHFMPFHPIFGSRKNDIIITLLFSVQLFLLSTCKKIKESNVNYFEHYSFEPSYILHI